MHSRRNRAIAAIVTMILLALPLTPVSAAAWSPGAPIQAEGLFAQLWHWLAGLLGGGDETSAVSTCSTAMPGGRGCAIDPNGGGDI